FVAALRTAQAPTPAGAAAHDASTCCGPPTPEISAGVPAELEGHDRYRIVRPLGAGGMGAVYQAEHIRMERAVALKVINRDLMHDAAAVERFRREVKVAARLAHPNIVTAFDADQAGGLHFLVMKFVEGVSLGRLVQEGGPLPVAEACDYIRQ